MKGQTTKNVRDGFLFIRKYWRYVFRIRKLTRIFSLQSLLVVDFHHQNQENQLNFVFHE